MNYKIGDKVLIQVSWTSINEKETIAEVVELGDKDSNVIVVKAYGNYFHRNVLTDYVRKLK